MNNLSRFNDPFAGLTSMHSQLDDIFNSFFETSSLPSIRQTIPAMDVYTEDDKQLVAEVHVPGFKKEDVDISVQNGVLEIKGEHSSQQEEKDKKRSYMVRESHTSFYRRLALPKHANPDEVKANFKNGVIKVIVPFKELPKPKKVAISDGK